MKRKIFLLYIILVIIGVTITGFFTSQISHRFYTQEVQQGLINNAYLIKYHLENHPSKNGAVNYNIEAARYSEILNKQQVELGNGYYTRITFINFAGKVLGESKADYREMENKLDRPEIQQAIKGSVGLDKRFSNTLKVDFLYVAVPVASHNLIIRLSIPLLKLTEINNIIWKYAALGILAGILLTTILALRFSYSLTNPINELSSLSRDIAGGNYSKRVNVVSKDELGELAKAFNEMAYKLEKTVADLKDKNIKFDSVMHSMSNGIIAVDRNFRIILINSIACKLFNISEQEAMGNNFTEGVRNSKINKLIERAIKEDSQFTEEIRNSRHYDNILRITAVPLRQKEWTGSNSGGIISIHDITNIKKLEQIRTEFVSNVTHELKTPLTSIRGFVETLRNGAINDPGVAGRFLEIIDIEAERLYTLINDILQLSEIETKQRDTNIKKFKFLPLLKETISVLEGSAESKKIRIKYNVEENLNIIANSNRIKQMLINLIDNAIKYNRKGGYVSITAYKAEGSVIVIVKDNGIGIPEDHQKRIFERFYRVDKGRSRSMGGTGLGLSIVKHIVNLYSGNIKIISKPGGGTEFIIQLPM